jgi:hypothetical protein
MAEIVNLRRARKNKVRAEKQSDADASRAKHGVARQARARAEKEAARAKRDLDAHRLDAGKE